MSRHFSPVGVSLVALGAVALAIPGIAHADSTARRPGGVGLVTRKMTNPGAGKAVS